LNEKEGKRNGKEGSWGRDFFFVERGTQALRRVKKLKKQAKKLKIKFYDKKQFNKSISLLKCAASSSTK
jgi:hypothetical protein